MTDINRRGFLQLLAAGGALALVPRVALAALQDPARARLQQGLWLRYAGSVRYIGALEAIEMVHTRDVVEVQSPYADARLFAPTHFNSEFVGHLVLDRETATQSTRALHEIIDNMRNPPIALNDSYRTDLIAVMRTTPQPNAQRIESASSRVFVHNGDMVFASRGAVLTDVGTTVFEPDEFIRVQVTLRLGTHAFATVYHNTILDHTASAPTQELWNSALALEYLL